MSYTTRSTPFTSLMMRVAVWADEDFGKAEFEAERAHLLPEELAQRRERFKAGPRPQ